MKKLILAASMALLIGCESNQVPRELNSAERPIIIKALNSKGIVLVDADGRIYAYSNTYYFVGPLLTSGLKSGDTLSPNQAAAPNAVSGGADNQQ